jgi:hypothetical protein
MNMRRTVLLAIAMGCLALSHAVQPEPPLVIKFLGQCRLPKERVHVYDPNTGVFHIEFAGYGESGFEVVKVAKGTTKPVVFHLTGLPDMYGFDGLPLTLAVNGKNYLIDMKRDPGPSEYNLIRDDSLFRVESKFVTEYTYERPIRMIEVTIEFTEKGRLLLKPGTRIFCVMLTYW